MKINDFPELSLQPNLIPVQSISNDTSNSKASSTSTSSDSTTATQAQFQFELSQVYDDPLTIVWELIKNSETLNQFFIKKVSLIDSQSISEDSITSNISKSNTYNKAMTYTLSTLYVTFTFTLIANTLENSTLLTISSLSKTNKLNVHILKKISGSLVLFITDNLRNNFGDIKHYESTTLKVPMQRLWDFVTKWEFKNEPGFVFTNVMLNGDPYEIGTEISMVCDNQFICNLRVLNYDKETESHSWQYML